MENSKKDNITYLTGVTSKNKNETSKEQIFQINSPIKKIRENSRTIDHFDPKSAKKIISIKFPMINPLSRKNNLEYMSPEQKKSKMNQEVNKSDLIYKPRKNNISITISKLKNSSRRLYYNNDKNNNSIDNDSKSSSIYINSMSISNNYCITSVKEKSKTNLKQKKLEDRNYFIRNNSKKKYNNLLYNKSSSKTKLLKKKLIDKENTPEYNMEKFLKKELELEKRKDKLHPSLIEKLSSRLFFEKKINDNNNDKCAENDEEYKIRTVIFNNQTIPYVEKIDMREMTLNLPKIVIGSKYGLKDESIENSKKDMLEKVIEKKENEKKKGKSFRNQQKLTKKEIFESMKSKKLINCHRLIEKTTKNIHKTKNKIFTVYNNLKISLNEYDDWNSPKNVDNLYDK